MREHGMEKLIHIDILEKRYGKNFQLRIEDLTIAKNKMTVIMGKTGCGKSTFLDLIGLNLAPDHSNVEYFLEDNDLSIQLTTLWQNEGSRNSLKREKFGYLFQEAYFLPFITIRENIAIPALLKEMEYAERVSKLLKSNLFEDGERKTGNELSTECSGGQNQRLAFFRSLIHNPNILIADEPTGNLDKSTARKLFEHLKLWCIQENCSRTIILATHDQDLAIDYADYIFFMNERHQIGMADRFSKKNDRWSNGYENFTHKELSQKISELFGIQEHLSQEAKIDTSKENNIIKPTYQLDASQADAKAEQHSIAKFKRWYTCRDYNPQDNTERKLIWRNKLIYFCLFLVGFLSLALLKSFQSYVDTRLNDPYVRSVPLEIRDTDLLIGEVKKSIPSNEIRPVFPIWAEAYSFVAADTSSHTLFGAALDITHPYLKTILSKENTNLIHIKNINESIFGIILTEASLKNNLKLTRSYQPIDTIKVRFKLIDGVTINDSVKVLAVCKALPEDFHFVIFTAFGDQINNSYFESKDKSRMRLIISKDSTLSNSRTEQYKRSISEYLSKRKLEPLAIRYLGDANPPSLVEVVFRVDTTKAAMQNIVDGINNYLKNLRMTEIFLENTDRELMRVEKKYYSESYCTSFTVSIDSLAEAYILKSNLEKNFKEKIKFDTKSVHMVSTFGQIERSIDLLRLGIVIFVLIISSILNYKILTFHLFRKRQQLGYLKTLGLSWKVFRDIYISQAMIETFVFGGMSILIMYLIQRTVNNDLFHFVFDEIIVLFIVSMGTVMLLSYILVTYTMLRGNSRQIMKSV